MIPTIGLSKSRQDSKQADINLKMSSTGLIVFLRKNQSGTSMTGGGIRNMKMKGHVLYYTICTEKKLHITRRVHVSRGNHRQWKMELD